jgi:hypothetical protein
MLYKSLHFISQYYSGGGGQLRGPFFTVSILSGEDSRQTDAKADLTVGLRLNRKWLQLYRFISPKDL